MAEWLDELNHLEEQCDKTEDCKYCKLGRCIKEKHKTSSESGVIQDTINQRF